MCYDHRLIEDEHDTGWKRVADANKVLSERDFATEEHELITNLLQNIIMNSHAMNLLITSCPFSHDVMVYNVACVS